MELKELKSLQLEARKQRSNKAPILTLIIGEYQTAEKGGRAKTVDEIIEKLCKNLKDTIDNKQKIGADCEADQLELDFLITLLPAKASGEEISEFLDNVMFSTIPEAFKALDGKFGKNYDKGVASKIIRGKM